MPDIVSISARVTRARPDGVCATVKAGFFFSLENNNGILPLHCVHIMRHQAIVRWRPLEKRSSFLQNFRGQERLKRGWRHP
jgi:hypothetical protein